MVSPNLCSHSAFRHADVEVRGRGFVHLHAAVGDHKHGPIWEPDVSGSQGLELDQLCLTETCNKMRWSSNGVLASYFKRRRAPWRLGRRRLSGPAILFLSLPGRKWTGPCLLPPCQCSAHIWHRARPAPPGGLQTEHSVKISAVRDVDLHQHPGSRFHGTQEPEVLASRPPEPSPTIRRSTGRI